MRNKILTVIFCLLPLLGTEARTMRFENKVGHARQLKLEGKVLTYSALKGADETKTLPACGEKSFTAHMERLLKRPYRSCPQSTSSIVLEVGQIKTTITECMGALPSYESVLTSILSCRN